MDDDDRKQRAAGSCTALHWNDVHQAATDLFAVWMNSAELRWAETCWTLLTQAGLTRYHSELGRCRAALHLLALADNNESRH